jgi:hypothetical protein
VVLSYAVYVMGAAVTTALPRRRRLTIVLAAGALAAGVFASTCLRGTAAVVRDWVPTLWVLGGYWMSGLFFVRPMPAVERWLLQIDHRLFRRLNASRLVAHAPRGLLEALELSYALCYPLVPAGYFVLVATGHGDFTDRYWTTVLGAELASYGMLPWIQTRPPRALDRENPIVPRPLAVRGLNLSILGGGSIQVNTVPSGHAAGAVAIALSVTSVLPAAGIAFLALAVSIMVASVVGRYHYMVDAALGAAVGVAAWWIVWK